ncbi:unnamed protein product [Cunninghamella echinulata]
MIHQNKLPIELLDYIISFTDTSTLYELYKSSSLLQILSSKYIDQYHINSLSIRLWIHQPGKVSHLPIDFFPLPIERRKEKEYQCQFQSQQNDILFDTKQPIYIDGCTIIHKEAKKHYSLSYHDDPIILLKNDDDNCNNNEEKETFSMEKPLQWLLFGAILHQQKQKDSFKCQSLTLSCDYNFLNPVLLNKKIKHQVKQLYERIQYKKLYQSSSDSPVLFNNSSSSSSIYLTNPPSTFTSPTTFKLIE